MPELTRRQILLTMTFSPFVLAGCGGGGGGTGSGSPGGGGGGGGDRLATRWDVTGIRGRVDAPPGLSLAGLTVENLVSSAIPDAGGAFDAKLVAGGPMPTQVWNAQGRPVLLGWLTPTYATLDVHSTAAMLVFYGLGGYALPQEGRLAMVSTVLRAELNVVENAIRAAIAANGADWMTKGIRPVADAVKRAAEAIRGSSRAAASRASRATTLTPGPARSRGMILTPTEWQSGLQIETNNLDGFVAINNYRRRARIYVERISTKTGDAETPSYQLLAPVDISAVNGMTGTLQVISDFFNGSSFFEPIRSDFVSTPNAQGVDSTKYRITGVGIGVRQGQLAGLKPEIVGGLKELFFKSLVLDFAVPILANIVIPLRAENIDDFVNYANTSTALKDLINVLASTPGLWEQASTDGQLPGAIQAGIDLILYSDTLKLTVVHMLEEYLMSTLLRNNLRASYIDAAFAGISGVMGIPDFALSAFDAAIQTLSIGASRWAETWDLTVTKPKIHLNPLLAELDPLGSIQRFDVTVADADLGSGDVLSYEWTNTALFGTLRGPAPGQVNNFTAAQNSVSDTGGFATYNTENRGTLGDTDTITVTVYRGSPANPTRERLGTATAQVRIKKQLQLRVSPEQAEINTDGQIGLSAFFENPVPAGSDVRYEWSIAGPGSLTVTRADRNENEASVMYVAPSSEGTARVTVVAEVTRGDNHATYRTDPATVTITVKKGLRQLEITGQYLTHVTYSGQGDGARYSAGALYSVPKVVGAKSYTVTIDNFTDSTGAVRPGPFTFDPRQAVPSDGSADAHIQDLGGSYWIGLSGADGPIGNAGGALAWFDSRFQGMRVRGVVTLE